MQKADPHNIEDLDKLKKVFSEKEIKKKYVPIPEDEVEDVTKMNRKQRRTWLSKQRRKRKKKNASINSNTDTNKV